MADRNNPGGGVPPMTRSVLKLDSHHHLWRYDPAEYSWIGENQARLRRDFLPEDLKDSLADIDGVVSVQARQSVEETDVLLEHAEKWDFIRGVVGWLPLGDGDIGTHLERYAAHPKLKGLRHVIQDESDDDFILGHDFNRGIDKLLAYGLTYDILVYERQLPQVIRFVDLHPYQTFVLDHAGKPRIADEEMEPWRSQMQELAERVNVYCKISGLVTEAKPGQWKNEDIIPYIDAVVDLFGPERVMFGSDWPVCLLEIEYPDWVNLCAGYIASYSQSERRRFWAETAKEAYRL